MSLSVSVQSVNWKHVSNATGWNKGREVGLFFVAHKSWKD